MLLQQNIPLIARCNFMTHRSSTARSLITAILNDNLKDIQGILRLGASTEDATDALG